MPEGTLRVFGFRFYARADPCRDHERFIVHKYHAQIDKKDPQRAKNNISSGVLCENLCRTLVLREVCKVLPVKLRKIKHNYAG